MLIDANLLLYAVAEDAPEHQRTHTWWTDMLNGDRRIALPWQSIGAFVRIISHPRIVSMPLSGPEAWAFVREWLANPLVWVPPAGERTAAILGDLVEHHGLTGNAIPDAQLAALALEHGLPVCSADSDFARFPEVRWINPLVR